MRFNQAGSPMYTLLHGTITSSHITHHTSHITHHTQHDLFTSKHILYRCHVSNKYLIIRSTIREIPWFTRSTKLQIESMTHHLILVVKHYQYVHLYLMRCNNVRFNRHLYWHTFILILLVLRY